MTRYAVRRQGQAARCVVVKGRIRSDLLDLQSRFIWADASARVRHTKPPLVKLLVAPAMKAGDQILDQFVLVTLFKIQISRWFKNIRG